MHTSGGCVMWRSIFYYNAEVNLPIPFSGSLLHCVTWTSFAAKLYSWFSLTFAQDIQEKIMERRDFIKSGLAGATVGLMTASAASAQDHAHGHNEKKSYSPPPVNAELEKVAETAHDCVRHATACISECNRVLATGEGSMADCQEAVLSMISVCEATAENATMQLVNEKLLRNLVKVCAEFCDYCAEACEAHAEHYAECKNCMESCLDCSKACKAYLEA